jgi:glycerol-3-phosphate acyltransferase PlsY
MLTLTITGLAYVIGSLPFAWLMTRGRGLDLRTVGSRNMGASNVLRTAGVAPAVVVLLTDAGKGAIAVLVARALDDDAVVVSAAGVAAVLGHVYPAWLGFRGGKGVATAAGVFAVLAPMATAIAAAVFVVTVFVTRFISAGSMAGAVLLPLVAAIQHAPTVVVAAAIVCAVIVIGRHRENLARLASGTERRIGMRV